MGDRFADHDVIRRLLRESVTWAFVGLADNPHKTVWEQARLMKLRGKTIIPVHPSLAPVLGERTYATLSDIPGHVDVAAIYRRTEHAAPFMDEAIAVEAGALWLPLNVYDEDAGSRAQQAGLDVVMNRCPAVEWALRR